MTLAQLSALGDVESAESAPARAQQGSTLDLLMLTRMPVAP